MEFPLTRFGNREEIISFMNLQRIFFSIFFLTSFPFWTMAGDRIPFYEDYLKDSDFRGFLRAAEKFLESKPDDVEAPRLAMDYFMVAKAAQDINALNKATSHLLFDYTNSLPSLYFLSSFERGSGRLVQLLKEKAMTGDLADKEFALAFCRSILFIARSQGSELLKDSSLRLQAYLLAQKAEVDEITSAVSEVLREIAETNTSTGKVLKIVFGEGDSLEKLKFLSGISGADADFAKAFYLAQLNEVEVLSEEVIKLKIIQNLFGDDPNPSEAMKLIESLPEKNRNSARHQTFLGFAQHLNEDTDSAIKTLKSTPENAVSDDQGKWAKNAKSFANGLEFMENRKSLFLDSIGKAYDLIEKGGDSLLIKSRWFNGSGDDKESEIKVHLGISKSQEKIEIQLFVDNDLRLAYRTNQENSALMGPNLDKILTFSEPGVVPIPRFSIKRDISTGIFNYSFNLNFSSSFADLVKETGYLLENPYLSTNKGRDVLLSHLLARKGMWLLSANPIDSGTSYPIRLLDPMNSNPIKAEFSLDLAGYLSTLRFGNFTLSKFEIGDEDLLEDLSKWPDLPNEENDEFDFPLLMKIINQASNLGV